LVNATPETAVRHLDKWRLFLHSKQEAIVALPLKQNSVIYGGAGTGKTIALLHRAKRLIERSGSADSLVAIITYSEVLSEALVRLLTRLDQKAARRIAVLTNDMFCRLTKTVRNGKTYIRNKRLLHVLLDEAQDADVDLAEASEGPLFECQECGEQFDPDEDDGRRHFRVLLGRDVRGGDGRVRPQVLHARAGGDPRLDPVRLRPA
jgi:hypothetical protein